MGYFQYCSTQEKAESIVGVIAEYMDINCVKFKSDFREIYKAIHDYDNWVTENCDGTVVVYMEEQYNKLFLVLLFEQSSDAVAFKICWG